MKPTAILGRISRTQPSAKAVSTNGAKSTVAFPHMAAPDRPGAEDCQRIPSLVNGVRIPHKRPAIISSSVEQTAHLKHLKDK